MSKLRDAAQQALEALERADKISGYANNKRTITALRAALAEQPAEQSAKHMELVRGEWQGYTWNPYAIPQPAKPAEQEPVAAQHRFRHSQKGTPDWSVWQPCKVAQRPAWEVDSQGYEVEYRALYTAPQPAKQPLTREEIFEIAEPFGEFKYGDAQGHKRIDFARAIIAAYERKNGVQT